MDIEAQKRQAAAVAVEWVRPGMRLGLGTGSTAKHFVELLAERVRGGLKVVGVPTSEATRADARAPRRAADHARRDPRTRHDRRRRRRDRARPDPDQGRRRRAAAGKDRGGGLGPHGGDRRREQMGRRRSAAFRCRSRSCRSAWPRPGAPSRPRPPRPACPGPTRLRQGKDGHAFVTDGGHWILDAALGRIADPRALAERLSAIPGVVEHGLFIGLAQAVILAGPTGARVVERS